jgi:hypothetical protein
MTPADTLKAQIIWEPIGNEVIYSWRFNQTVIANDIWIDFYIWTWRSFYLELRGCDLEGKKLKLKLSNSVNSLL